MSTFYKKVHDLTNWSFGLPPRNALTEIYLITKAGVKLHYVVDKDLGSFNLPANAICIQVSLKSLSLSRLSFVST